MAEAGWPLFALHGEGRDLEALFREVNRPPRDQTAQEAAHV